MADAGLALPLLVQLPQVRSAASVPSALLPVMMSCLFGVSPRLVDGVAAFVERWFP